MKKLCLLTMLMLSCLQLIRAQEQIVLYMDDLPGDMTLCVTDNQQVLVYAQSGCDIYAFEIDGIHYVESPITINPSVHRFHIAYGSLCGESGGEFSHHFYIEYKANTVPNSFVEYVWAPEGEPFDLQAVGEDSVSYIFGYDIHWLNGPSTNNYSPTVPGDYTVTIGHPCGTATRIYKARHNVGIYRATVDLETNLNKVTWHTNELQAGFISQVKVYRDGFFVGTAPYENGYFLDAIGSNNAARNYHLVAVTTDGVESPASYQKGTIHTTYYLDVNDNLNMTWNIPYVEQGAQGSLTYFQICKYDPVTEQLTVVDQVNSLITDYTCGVNQFAGGYPVIAAVFSDAKNREFEDMSFSNMYTDLSIQPQEITITLSPGWTWFSYPYAEAMNIALALGEFVPMEGDIIKAQMGSISYRNGQWRGSVQQFNPGLGYMYFSARTEPATLVFDLSSSR